ncbi:unnamed protein product [Caretta caretta]
MCPKSYLFHINFLIAAKKCIETKHESLHLEAEGHSHLLFLDLTQNVFGCVFLCCCKGRWLQSSIAR